MSQHDYDVANGSGAAVRADLNLLAASIASQNSGATAPSTTFAYMLWADTTTGLLKQRNSANSAWITLWTIATGPAAQFLPLAGGTMTGVVNLVSPSRFLYSASTGSGSWYNGSVTADRYYLGGNSASDTQFRLYTSAVASNVFLYDSADQIFNFAFGRIGFPVTQNASSGANVFDDYEEGTTVPSWIVSVGSVSYGNATYDIFYTKVGRGVSVAGAIIFGTTSTYGTGYYTFGIPFTMVGSAYQAETFTTSYYDTSAGAHYIGGSRASGSGDFVPASGAISSLITSTAPFTWTSTDRLQFNIRYSST